jgi:hypothetical protein
MYPDDKTIELLRMLLWWRFLERAAGRQCSDGNRKVDDPRRISVYIDRMSMANNPIATPILVCVHCQSSEEGGVVRCMS